MCRWPGFHGSLTTWDEHVTSVLCDGEVHHGFTVDRLGVFIHEDNFTGTPVVKKFAGRIVKDCNREVPRLGVLTLSQRGGNSYNFSSADRSPKRAHWESNRTDDVT